ncbi:MAG: FAD-dependent oxidoreductase [Butyrivibrio sp.]|nr:FAD-dependent oxidoreductase [Butyrivibrio sp.]
MIRINQIKIKNDGKNIISKDKILEILRSQAAKLLRIDVGEIAETEIIRHSIDARKKPEIYDIYMIDVKLKKLDENKVIKKCHDKNVQVIEPVKYDFEQQVLLKGGCISDKAKRAQKRIVIIGEGPAGLFCGYMLAQNGFKPIILERGADVDTRTAKVEHFWKSGELDTGTNVQFGEGGAGTFSDGKLNTMVKDKDGRGREALSIFVKNGAFEDILYDAKPHIGTDILCDVVKNMRNWIIEQGGEVRFNTKVTDIIIDDGKVTKVKAGDEIFPCDAAVLAIGHSARDTFYLLKEKNVSMEKKPFAVGFRVEHPQTLINYSQYGMEMPVSLPPAPYKLTTTTDSGRGVYSFCMCPGGYVVNASSEEGRLAVNGMSYSKRDGKNANSAIIITVDPKDFGSEDVLSGVEFQRGLEEKAYKVGGGRIPVEYYGDFKEAVTSKALEGERSISERASEGSMEESLVNIDEDFMPQMKGEYTFSKVHEILPEELNKCFVEGMEKFGKMIKGYNSPKAVVSGVESRTSSPVRIVRGNGGESVNISGLYPCGEGAGYAGGIMSAAMDGMKIAEYIAANLQ